MRRLGPKQTATFELDDGKRFDVALPLAYQELVLPADGPAQVLVRRPELGDDVWSLVRPDELVGDGAATARVGAKASVDMLVERQGLPEMFRLVRAGERIPEP